MSGTSTQHKHSSAPRSLDFALSGFLQETPDPALPNIHSKLNPNSNFCSEVLSGHFAIFYNKNHINYSLPLVDLIYNHSQSDGQWS